MEFIMDDFANTDPNGIGSFFSQAALPPLQPPRGLQGEGGFGPGNYSGGYTGSELGGGHAIYWGTFDDASSTSQTIASLHGTKVDKPGHTFEGTAQNWAQGTIYQTGKDVFSGGTESNGTMIAPSSTGETVLEPSIPSEARTRTADASSTGETVLEPSSSRAANTIATELQEETSVRSGGWMS